MTETQWLTTGFTLSMLKQYPAEWDERKVRLFWCACLRRAWGRLTNDATRLLVGAVEDRAEEDRDTFVREHGSAFEPYWAVKRIVDELGHEGGQISWEYWAINAFLGTPPESLLPFVKNVIGSVAAETVKVSGLNPNSQAGQTFRGEAEYEEKQRQCRLLREIFGNPFRPVSVDPAWLTSDVLALAQGMYASRDFSAMPIMADALQDAGCESNDILSHCRQPGEHVRGCWVVDLLLGKG